mmetsp:Transcript_72167/g.114409  ORF Transcript_72167/g.114409 Transcript_72167/m.114409 type:complete len:288 (-) Transcript_72167:971-1834(-)
MDDLALAVVLELVEIKETKDPQVCLVFLEDEEKLETPEKWVSEELPEILDKMASKDVLGIRGLVGLLVQKELMDFRVHLEKMVIQVQTAMMEKKALEEIEDPLESMGMLDLSGQQDQLVKRVQKASREKMVSLEKTVVTENEVFKVQKDHLVCKEMKVNLDSLDLRVILVILVNLESRELRDHWVKREMTGTTEQQVPPDLRVVQAPLVLLDHKALLDQMDNKDFKVTPENRENVAERVTMEKLVSQVHPDCQENRAHQDRISMKRFRISAPPTKALFLPTDGVSDH